jgi:hypothetical protein
MVLCSIVSAVIALTHYTLSVGSQTESTQIVVYWVTVPLTVTVVLLSWVVSFSSMQYIARLLGGSGSYKEAAFVFAAINVPLTVIAALISVIWANWAIEIGLYLYWMVAYSGALMAVNKFSVWRAGASVLITIALLGFIVLGLLVPMIITFAEWPL